MFDEPLGALDRTLREDLLNELRAILHRTHIPAIYVTHDQEEAFTLADRILILSNGRISQSGSPEELFRFPASSWVANFLGLGTIIPAFVHSIEPFTVRTALGDIHCKTSGQGFKAGTKVDLLIRPNSVEISHGKQNVITGIVEDCVFQGDYFKTIVHVNGYVFTFNLHENHKPGDQLLFTFKDELVNCFEANHA
jgi:ABC-type Fe3+/spermidine/putrescine transport system ATPase subunit